MIAIGAMAFLILSVYYYHFLKCQTSKNIVAHCGHTLLDNLITLSPSGLKGLPRSKPLYKASHKEYWGQAKDLTAP
jgi:hypothetical protein